MVYAKCFSPWTGWTWFVTEGSAEEDDFIFFGYVIGQEPEWGYFSLAELESVRAGRVVCASSATVLTPARWSEVERRHKRQFGEVGQFLLCFLAGPARLRPTYLLHTCVPANPTEFHSLRFPDSAPPWPLLWFPVKCGFEEKRTDQMPRYWGFHYCQIAGNALRHWQGRDYPFNDIQADTRMRVGDYVFLFWANEFLYGWATIQRLGQPDAQGRKQIILHLHVSRENLAPVATEILGNPLFHNFARLQSDGLSTLDDDEQIRYLNALCQRGGSSPPDPADVREQKASAHPLRPVVTNFTRVQRVPMHETRFDEFKTINTTNIIPAILKELDEAVIAFLNLEDRHYEDYCRIFWGIDNTRVAVGITANVAQRDEIKNIHNRETARH